MFSRRSALLLNVFKRHMSSQNKNWQEVRIPVPWGVLAGKWWGPQDQRPVLCLHGWQDNCGTFDRLIPLLKKDVAFLAFDFPGHGYSSHLPPGMFYHPTTYFLCVNYLVRYFKWDTVYLLAHSLGGVMSFTYSIFCPNNVDFLICLDPAKPLVPRQSTVQVSREIQKFMKYESHQRSDLEPPSYTFEEIKQKLAQALSGSIKLEYSHLIALRNVKESIRFPGKFYFNRDPRLKVAPILHWEQSLLVENLQNMKFPMLIMKALTHCYYDPENNLHEIEGFSEPEENFYEVMDGIAKTNKDFHLCELEGTHHLHLNNPEELSEAVNNFLVKYHKVDKSKGGIREDIIHNA